MNSLSLRKSPAAIKLQTLLSLVASSVRPGRSCWREPADVAPSSEHIFLTSVVPPLSSTRARGCFPAPSVFSFPTAISGLSCICHLWGCPHWGREVCTERGWLSRAVLSCWHTGTGSSRSAQSEHHTTFVLRIDPGSFLLLSAYFHKTQRGTRGPDPGPVGTKMQCGAQT